MPINQHTAEETYQIVLDNAGATLPERDAVDTRIVQETRNGTATYEGIYKARKRISDQSGSPE